MEDDEEEEKRKRRKRRRTRTSISRSEYQPEFVRCWSRMCGSGNPRIKQNNLNFNKPNTE